MVDVVVLSDDVALFQATRDAIGERNPVWRARTAAESVELLLTGRCGVLMLDMGAVSTQPASLVTQIVDQFPDVVVVVAGRRDDEPLLAQLVSDGHVYRFMHKPLSPKRAGMFLQAAIRAHARRRESHDHALHLPGVGTLRSRFDPRKWLFVGGGLALFVAALGAVLVARHEADNLPTPAQVVARPAATPAQGPRADPVLSRARAALAAGRYESPPGRNALDLYAAVLLARPGNAEASAGLAATATLLVERAETALASGDAPEARRLAERVLTVSADQPRARELLARLEAPPVPVTIKATTPPTPVGTSAPAAEPPRRPAQSPRKARITRDPLTPRIIPPPPSPPTTAQAGPTRSHGAPIPSGLPVAGYVAQDPVAAVESVDSGNGPAIQARDLEALVTPEPVYPPEAFRHRVKGWTEVEFTVDERGTTGDIVVVAAEPRGVFDAAAVGAVAAWRYRPRVVHGQPVAQRTSVTLRFSVED